MLLLFSAGNLRAEDPPKAANDLFRIGEMAQAAKDMREASETLERVMNTSGGLIASIAESLATMSSEFDPFGYKTAFRTVGQQAEIIEQQRKLIDELQQREIDRLQRENRELAKELQKLRKADK